MNILFSFWLCSKRKQLNSVISFLTVYFFEDVDRSGL
jgi:hypothetical protein